MKGELYMVKLTTLILCNHLVAMLGDKANSPDVIKCILRYINPQDDSIVQITTTLAGIKACQPKAEVLQCDMVKINEKNYQWYVNITINEPINFKTFEASSTVEQGD